MLYFRHVHKYIVILCSCFGGLMYRTACSFLNFALSNKNFRSLIEKNISTIFFSPPRVFSIYVLTASYLGECISISRFVRCLYLLFAFPFFVFAPPVLFNGRIEFSIIPSSFHQRHYTCFFFFIETRNRPFFPFLKFNPQS